MRRGAGGSPVLAYARATCRRDWRALLLLAVAVAVASALVMTAAVGARRAASAWDRFARATESPDVFKDFPVDEGEAALADVIARPGVRAAALMGFMVVVPEGRVPVDAPPPGAFVGLSSGFGTDVYQPLILRGRAANPDRSDEFTINSQMAELTGLEPGNEVTLVSFPDAVNQPATMVGVHAGPLDVTLNAAQPLALLTPAFGAIWFETYLSPLPPELRSNFTTVVMASVEGDEGATAMLAEGFVTGRAFGSEAIAGLNAQRTAFTALALATALGTLLAVGQAVSRRLRRDADQLPILTALGMTPRERQTTIAMAPCAAALVGFAVAPFMAYVASPVVSTGVAGRLEPRPPIVIDLTIMVAGPAVGLVFVVVVAWSAARRADMQPTASQPHPTPIRLPGPAGLFGGRVASGWGTQAARMTARSHVLGVISGVAAITGVAVWSGAARHVVSTPSRYGVTWDATISANEEDRFSFDPGGLNPAAERLQASPDAGSPIARIVAGMHDGLPGESEIIAIDRTSGSWWPTIIAGRIPVGDDEITVGTAIPGVGLGDTVDLDGRSLRIVGKHVVIPLSNGASGMSIAMSAGTVAEQSLTFPTELVLVDLAPGATLDDVQRVAGEGLAVSPSTGSRPGDIANLGRTAGLNDVLLVACVALTLAIFANGLIVTTLTRRDDYATLRALGARRRTIAGSIAWHGGLVASISVVVGIPAGLVLGRTVWRRTASGINAVPDLWRWATAAAAIAAATFVVCGVIVAAAAAIPGRRPAMRPRE